MQGLDDDDDLGRSSSATSALPYSIGRLAIGQLRANFLAFSSRAEPRLEWRASATEKKNLKPLKKEEK